MKEEKNEWFGIAKIALIGVFILLALAIISFTIFFSMPVKVNGELSCNSG